VTGRRRHERGQLPSHPRNPLLRAVVEHLTRDDPDLGYQCRDIPAKPGEPVAEECRPPVTVHLDPFGTRSQLAQGFGRCGDIRDSGVCQADPATGRHPYRPVRGPAEASSLILVGLELVREVERE
jgi:hypothetical protein